MNIASSLENIILELGLYRKLCEHTTKSMPTVSGWTVGQHIEHVLKVNLAGVKIVTSEQPSANTPIRPAGFRSHLILLFGIIPRGRAKAPKGVEPSGQSSDQLLPVLEQCVRQLCALRARAKEFERNTELLQHPVLNGLTRRQWIRFVEVHQHHHYKIISDILRGA